jgi:hypothetical protein
MFDFELQRPDGMDDDTWEAYVDQALKLIKKYTPVKTGKLRNGWSLADLNPYSAIISNDVPYAEFVNDGTPYMAARNMTGLTLAALGRR